MKPERIGLSLQSMNWCRQIEKMSMAALETPA
jgi:hypothetical protein